MKIQQLHFRQLGKLPSVPKQAEAAATLDSVESSRWQKIGKTALKGVAGAAVGIVPAAVAGYAVASLGGVPGAVIGGAAGVVVGYLSGKQVREVAEKMAAKSPDKLNFFHKAALKIGPAAPLVWAALAGAECALAGATFAPVVSALVFGKKGMIAGALLMGTKH